MQKRKPPMHYRFKTGRMSMYSSSKGAVHWSIVSGGQFIKIHFVIIGQDQGC